LFLIKDIKSVPKIEWLVTFSGRLTYKLTKLPVMYTPYIFTFLLIEHYKTIQFWQRHEIFQNFILHVLVTFEKEQRFL